MAEIHCEVCQIYEENITAERNQRIAWSIRKGKQLGDGVKERKRRRTICVGFILGKEEIG